MAQQGNSSGPDWKCLLRPVGHALAPGPSADHWGHVVAREAFTGELWGSEPARMRFDDWGRKLGLHASGARVAAAHAALLELLGPGETQRLRHQAGTPYGDDRDTTLRFPDGVVVIPHGPPRRPHRRPPVAATVSAVWTASPAAIATRLMSRPDFLLGQLSAPTARVRAAVDLVQQREAEFIKRGRTCQDMVSRLAERAARDWRLPWAWAPDDIEHGFAADLYRRALGIDLTRALYRQNHRPPPPFVFQPRAGEPWDTALQRCEAEQREYFHRHIPRRPNGSPPHREVIEEGSRWLFSERVLGLLTDRLGKARHAELGHTRPYSVCRCDNRPKGYRRRAERLLALAL
jgi:hypothetical protein